MYNPIEEKRRLVQERISKSFDNGINIAEEMSLEKAKYQVGEPHPNNPNILWTEWQPGKFDWKSKNGKYWKGKTGGAKAGASIGTSKTKSSDNEKTWDKLDDFNKKGSDENNLWNSWYKYQKSGDPSHISTFRNILEKKFPKVAEWNQTSPNTGKAVITAKDSDGKDIASIDLSGNEVSLTKLQTFMDKCHDISKKDAGNTGNSIDSVWDDNAGGYKTEPFKGAVKVDSLKVGDKLQMKNGKIYTIKSVNNNANNTVDIVMNNSSKIVGGVHVQTYNKSGYIGAKKVDSRDKIAQDAGFKDYEEMEGYQDYVTQKNLLKKRSTSAGTRLLYQQEIDKYEKDHADLIKRIGK